MPSCCPGRVIPKVDFLVSRILHLATAGTNRCPSCGVNAAALASFNRQRFLAPFTAAHLGFSSLSDHGLCTSRLLLFCVFWGWLVAERHHSVIRPELQVSKSPISSLQSCTQTTYLVPNSPPRHEPYCATTIFDHPSSGHYRLLAIRTTRRDALTLPAGGDLPPPCPVSRALR